MLEDESRPTAPPGEQSPDGASPGASGGNLEPSGLPNPPEPPQEPSEPPQEPSEPSLEPSGLPPPLEPLQGPKASPEPSMRPTEANGGASGVQGGIRARGFLSRFSSRFFGGVGVGSIFSFRVVLEALSAAIMLLVVVGVVTLWWLAKNPTKIDLAGFSDTFPAFRTALANNLAKITGQEQATIGEISLTWDTGDFWFVQLGAEDIELRASDGSLSGRLSAIEAKASVRNFLRGQVTIPYARIYGLTVPIQLDLDAQSDIASQLDTDESREVVHQLPEDFSLTRIDFGDIQEIILSDLRLLIEGRSGVRLASPLAGDLTFRRGETGTGFAVKGLLQEPAGEGLGSGAVEFVLAYTPSATASAETSAESLSSSQIELQFSGFHAARWSNHMELLQRVHPSLGDISSHLDGLRLSLAGAGSVWLDRTAESMQLRRADFSLSGSPGTVDVAPFYEEPLPVFAFSLEGRWNRQGEAATLFSDSSKLNLHLSNLLLGDIEETGPIITAVLSLDLNTATGATTEVQADFSVADVSMAWFRRLWREGDFSAARSWVVSHIHEGVGQSAQGSFALTGDAEDIKLTALDLTFALSDLRLNYYGDLPEVFAPAAEGKLTLDGLTFTIPTAESAGMQATNAEVRIAPRGQDGNWWRSGLVVTGESRASAIQVRDFLEDESLRLLSRYGISAPRVAGTVASEFRVALPLKNRLTDSDLVIEVASDLRDFRWDRLYGELGLTQATAHVLYDTGALSASGRGVLFTSAEPTKEQGAISFDWQRKDNRELLNLSFQKLDSDILRHAEGMETLLASARFFGTLDGVLALTQSEAASDLSGELTLTDLALTPTGLNWNKPRGEEAILKFRAENRDGTWRELWLDEFSGSVTAPEVPTRAKATIDEEAQRAAYGNFAVHEGKLSFTESGVLDSANFASVHLGRIDLAGVSLTRDSDGATEIRADQSRSLSLFRSKKDRQGSDTTSVTTEDANGKGLRLTFSQIGRLYTAEDAWLQNAELEISRAADGSISRFILAGRIPEILITDSERARWERLVEQEAKAQEGETAESTEGNTEPPEAKVSTADLPAWREVSVRYGANSTNSTDSTDSEWQADLAMNPFGAGLRALAFTDKVQGGTFQGSGRSAQPWPQAPLELSATASNFQVLDLNAFVQLVSLLSLTGVIESLTGEGVSFNNLESRIALTEDEVILRDFFMSGERLGLTASGTTSIQGQNSEIQGAVVPAYLFNNLVSKIPLIGTILSGGEEREGVFAINYTLKGSLAEPQISSNPVSVIAPGFLRRLFGGGAHPIEAGEESSPNLE